MENKPIFVFAYKKQNDIIALNHNDAKEQNGALINDGWEHIATIDAISFIKYYLMKEYNLKQS